MRQQTSSSVQLHLKREWHACTAAYRFMIDARLMVLTGGHARFPIIELPRLPLPFTQVIVYGRSFEALKRVQICDKYSRQTTEKSVCARNRASQHVNSIKRHHAEHLLLACKLNPTCNETMSSTTSGSRLSRSHWESQPWMCTHCNSHILPSPLPAAAPVRSAGKTPQQLFGCTPCSQGQAPLSIRSFPAKCSPQAPGKGGCLLLSCSWCRRLRHLTQRLMMRSLGSGLVCTKRRRPDTRHKV